MRAAENVIAGWLGVPVPEPPPSQRRRRLPKTDAKRARRGAKTGRRRTEAQLDLIARR